MFYKHVRTNTQSLPQPTYSMGSQPLYVMYPDESTVNNARNAILKTLGQEPEQAPEESPEQ